METSGEESWRSLCQFHGQHGLGSFSVPWPCPAPLIVTEIVPVDGSSTPTLQPDPSLSWPLLNTGFKKKKCGGRSTCVLSGKMINSSSETRAHSFPENVSVSLCCHSPLGGWFRDPDPDEGDAGQTRLLPCGTGRGLPQPVCDEFLSHSRI